LEPFGNKAKISDGFLRFYNVPIPNCPLMFKPNP